MLTPGDDVGRGWVMIGELLLANEKAYGLAWGTPSRFFVSGLPAWVRPVGSVGCGLLPT